MNKEKLNQNWLHDLFIDEAKAAKNYHNRGDDDNGVDYPIYDGTLIQVVHDGESDTNTDFVFEGEIDPMVINGAVKVKVPKSDLGDAPTHMVVEGWEFTSKYGIKSEGTMPIYDYTPLEAWHAGEDEEGNFLFAGSTPKQLVVEDEVNLKLPKSNFGDAKPDDVRAGKIFTSANGVMQVGTNEREEDILIPTPSLVYTLSSDESYYIVGTGFTSIEAIEADIGGGTEGSGLDSSWQGGRVVIPSEYNGRPVLAVAPRAFAGFYDITQVYVHDGITHFGHRSFQCPNKPWDTAMTSCRLPNTLVWIGGEDGRVFYGRQGLTSIHIPPNVSELTRAVFAYCNAITAAYTYNVKKLVRSCFQDCSSLTALNADNMEEIGDVSFYNCTNLKEINLPKVEIIGNNVFHNTTSLTKVTIGQNCRSIDASGLRCGSTSNKCTFYFEGTTPPTIQSTTFDETTLNKIIVPKGCGNTYKTATNWARLSSYIQEEA